MLPTGGAIDLAHGYSFVLRVPARTPLSRDFHDTGHDTQHDSNDAAKERTAAPVSFLPSIPLLSRGVIRATALDDDLASHTLQARRSYTNYSESRENMPGQHDDPPRRDREEMRSRRYNPLRSLNDDKFDKFTERARKVLRLAQDEAQRLRHNYIGTEHLLLGLVREREGVAGVVLTRLGADLEGVRQSVEQRVGQGDRVVLGEVGMTPRAKKVMELAVDEARRFNHHYIGTEHLLLGVIREGEGIAAGVLESLGLRLEQVRRAVLEE